MEYSERNSMWRDTIVRCHMANFSGHIHMLMGLQSIEGLHFNAWKCAINCSAGSGSKSENME